MAVIQVALQGKRNQLIAGTIRHLDLFRDTLTWYSDWYPQMFDLSGNRLYQDSHWDVPAIWQLKEGQKEYMVRILEAEGQIQGFIVLQTQGFLGIDQKACASLDFIATAPWTRKSVLGTRRFRGVGKLLLGASLMYGYKHTSSWNLQLLALSDAEGFYQKQGMKPTGIMKDGMKEYRIELPESLVLAKYFLNKTIK